MLFIGDLCGDLGVQIIHTVLPVLIEQEHIDFTIVNGENANNGVGILCEQSSILFNAGVDVITGGNHSLERFDVRKSFGTDERILRPANYPFAQGSGMVQMSKAGMSYCVLNLQGREHMKPIDCPFQTVDRLLSHCSREKSIIFVDFHAESSQEKEALAYYLDGRVSFVAGSHTHTQTVDERILSAGTGYITDAGMTGSFYSVIGGDITSSIKRGKTQRPQPRHVVEEGQGLLSGILVHIDPISKKTIAVKRIYRLIPCSAFSS